MRGISMFNGKMKALTFSYDDGCKQDIKTANVLSKYRMKGTFNLNNYALHGDYAMSEEEVKTNLLANGHEIAVHGAMHRAPGTLSALEGIKDALDCRIELEQKYDRIVRGMAYPDSGIRLFSNNATYDKIKQYLTDLGIVYARTLGSDNNSFQLPYDWHSWMPTVHHNNPKTMEYIDEFLKLDLTDKTNCARRYPRLFYVWGHSFEFDRDNNWHVLEQICEKFSGCNDIWFATNMEIYEYTNAYNSLVYSADGNIIYNPTSFKIWLDVDGKEFSVNPGETIHIK